MYTTEQIETFKNANMKQASGKKYFNGTILKTNNYGDIEILGKDPNNKRLYLIRFLNTGNIDMVDSRSLKTGSIKDDSLVESLDYSLFKPCIHDNIVFDKYLISKDGIIVSLNKKLLLKHTLNEEGYAKVTLYKDGERHTLSVHRIVACTFMSNDNNFSDVNHIDGNKSNNNVDNLEFCTRQHNRIHAIENGLANHEHCKKKVKIPSMNKEFDSILDCANFLIEIGLTSSKPIHIAKSIGNVINGNKSSYLKLKFVTT